MKLTCISSGSKNGNAYLLTANNGRSIFLDCGVPTNSIQVTDGFKPTETDFVLVTHKHKDHSLGIPYFTNLYIDVFSCRSVAENYRRVKVLEEGKLYSGIGGWKVIPFQVTHTNADPDSLSCENYAYIISNDDETFLYMTDWLYCKYDLSKFGINHFLIAVNYTEKDFMDGEGNKPHVLKGHSSLGTAKGFLSSAITDECRNIIACHLSDRHSDENEILSKISALVPETVNVATTKKGTVINL